jgi:cytochrome c553
MTDTPVRFTLRDLPLPAKLVVTCFLIAVGLGYFSALVQLHMQHSSRSGEHLPSPGDVVEVFAGKRKADPQETEVRPISKLERLIMGPIEGLPWNGQGSMAAAFFHKDDGNEYRRAIKADPTIKDKLDAERNGERLALQAWINTPNEARQAAYDADRFELPPELANQPMTADYRDGPAAKVKSILADRCVRCHSKDGSESSYPLETYAQLSKYLKVPPVTRVVDGWVPSDRQISIEKLTQSTHAHLLSFAMLFSLTGLTFAFTSYSVGIRCLLAPTVLIVQVMDVACWWLARIDGVGVYFATAIIGTGGIVALGLVAQIVLSLFDMYGPKGKVVILLLFLLAGVVFGVVYKQAIAPALQAQRDALTAQMDKQPADDVTPEPAKPQTKPADDDARPVNAGSEPQAMNGVVPLPVSQLERLIMGPIEGADWDGSPTGSMAAAFFHKDDGNEYRRAIKENPAIKDQLDAERNGERLALQAWIRSDEPARKAAYETDRFPLPPELADRPMTADYRDGPAAKVKSILVDRCLRCHSEEGNEPDYPLETYEQLLKYMVPERK